MLWVTWGIAIQSLSIWPPWHIEKVYLSIKAKFPLLQFVCIECHPLPVHLQEKFGSIFSVLGKTLNLPGLFPQGMVKRVTRKIPADFTKLWNKPLLQNWDQAFLFGHRKGLRSPAILAWVSSQHLGTFLAFRGLWIWARAVWKSH